VGGRALAAADAVVALSSSEAELLNAHFPDISTTVIPSGVDLERLAEAQPVATPGKTILTVSRLVPYKKTASLVSAMQHLSDDVHLVVIGSGPEAPRLEGLAQKLGISGRVRLLGNVSDEDLARWYVSADLFVSLSAYESFGLAPLESIAAGTPVLASDIPAHRDLKQFDEHGTLQLIAEGADGQDIAEQALTALRGGRSACSSLAPTWEANAHAHERLYKDLLCA
jgi:glycosyltransferase involved in cell wall biosynthesis